MTYIRLHKLCQLNHIVFCFKKTLRVKKQKQKQQDSNTARHENTM